MPRVSAAYLAARRDHILSAAAARFAREGFHQTSMQDVIDAAGLSPGAVYRYFRSKDEIIVAISVDAVDAVEQVVRDALHTGRPFAALVTDLPRALAALDRADDRMRLAVQAWGEALRNPTLAAAMDERLGRLRAALRSQVAAGQHRGDVDPAVDPDAAVPALLALVQGFILQRAFDPALPVDVYAHGAGDLVAGRLARPPGQSGNHPSQSGGADA